jgi:AraC-like DNA-binding protein
MDLAKWKAQLPPVFNQVCSEVRVDDAVVDWIDIIFEQTGNAAKCRPHMHAWFEFNYVLEGEMETGFGGSLVPIRSGEFFLVPPDTVHEHVYRRRQPHEGLCLRWRIRRAPDAPQNESGETSSLYKRLVRLKDWTPGSYRDRDRYGIRTLIWQFLEAAEAGRSVLSLQLTLIQLLEALTRIHQPDERPLHASAGNHDQLVKKVDVYLQDWQSGRFNAEELAASLHMSYGHLSRLYRKRTGYTIVERMNEIRLEKAGRLLRSSALPVKLVAEQAGFADMPYFSRAFKKRYGVSPLQYRSGQEE